MIANWFLNKIAFLFIKLFDFVAYNLLSISYNIFYAVSEVNLFGAGSAGQELYDKIVERLYTVISILMIFVFAYQLIMLIINPDRGHDKGKAPSALIKDTLISLIFICLCPTIFKYMALFQNHVLIDNSIGAIISGTNGAGEKENPGQNVAVMTLISFYHPDGTTYTTFFDEKGKLRSEDDVVELCKKVTDAGKHQEDACKVYREKLGDWIEGKGGVTAIISSKVIDYLGEGVEYMWVLSTIGALAIAWFFLSYSIDLGTRAVKLGVLQLIAPLPWIFKIFPSTHAIYDKWFNQIKKIYLEIFIRVAAIFLILELINLIPLFLEIIFESGDSVGTGLTRCIATVVLILGFLAFAKEAPTFFKELFSTGGNLLSGINFKPGVRKRVEDNEYAMKGIGMTTGAVTGGVARAVRSYRDQMAKGAGAGSNSGFGRRLKAVGAAAGGSLRGIARGGISGFNNSPTALNREALGSTVTSSVNAVHNSYNDLQQSRADHKARVAARKGMSSNREKIRDIGNEMFGDMAESVGDWGRNTKNLFTGGQASQSLVVKNASEAITAVDSIINNADTEALDKIKAAAEAKFNNGETYKDVNDGKTYAKVPKNGKTIAGTEFKDFVKDWNPADGGYRQQHTDSSGNSTFYYYDKNDNLVGSEEHKSDGSITYTAKDGSKTNVAFNAGDNTYTCTNYKDITLADGSKKTIEEKVVMNKDTNKIENLQRVKRDAEGRILFDQANNVIMETIYNADDYVADLKTQINEKIAQQLTDNYGESTGINTKKLADAMEVCSKNFDAKSMQSIQDAVDKACAKKGMASMSVNEYLDQLKNSSKFETEDVALYKEIKKQSNIQKKSAQAVADAQASVNQKKNDDANK